MIELLKHFPDAAPIRRSCRGDVCYADRELQPGCGFMSNCESEILRDLARSIGGQWCEVGSHVGWSAAVLASAGCSVVMVDPEYGDGATLPVRQRAIENLTRAGLLDRVELVGRTSADFFNNNARRFNGFLIDGCHDAPVPLEDAKSAAARLLPGGAIVLHDHVGQPVKDAAGWLASQGFTVEVDDTMNGLAVCRRPTAGATE